MSLTEIGERINNSLSALDLMGFNGSVHTKTSEVGSVTRVNVISGKVRIRTTSGEEKEYLGSEVADLDTPLEDKTKKKDRFL